MGVLSTTLFTAPTLAEQITAQSRIISATVFPVGAQITRTIPITLTKGKHTITLNNLPSGMIADSIIINPSADSGIKIKSIDTRYMPVPEEEQAVSEEYKQLEEQLEKLNEEKTLLESELRTARKQQTYLDKLSNIPDSKTGESQPDWASIFTLITEKTAEINRKTFETNKKLKDLRTKITLTSSKLKQLSPRQRYRHNASLHIEAEKDTTTELQFKYQVHARYAGWQQQYEAHLNTTAGLDKAALKIIRSASIRQNTGEDWSNIKLSLSTSSPAQGTAAPDMDPLRLVLSNPTRGRKYSSGNYPRNMVSQQAAQESDVRFFEDPVDKISIASKKSQVTFHTLYNVPETVTLIANGNRKQIPMGEFSAKPSLRAITVPRLKKLAYLSAKFTMPKNINSAQGTTHIYRDGTYVGKGHLPNLTSGAEYKLGFGVDNKIQVKHVELNRTKDRQSGILSSTRTEERHYRMTIKNFHNGKIPVTIMDRYPFAYEKEIQVKLESSTTKPTRNNVEDKRGVLSWDREIEPGKQAQIDLSYKVTWPADKVLDSGRIYKNNKAQKFFGNNVKF